MGDENGSDSALDGDSFGDYGGILVSQQGSVTSGPASVKEFPVNLKQNIIAGGTPVGMKVQAKLTVATFVMELCFQRIRFFLDRLPSRSRSLRTVRRGLKFAWSRRNGKMVRLRSSCT